MSNPFDQMRQAVREAQAVNQACDQHCNAMVDLLRGRLRNVSPYLLQALKRELAGFNASTKQWKDRS